MILQELSVAIHPVAGIVYSEEGLCIGSSGVGVALIYAPQCGVFLLGFVDVWFVACCSFRTFPHSRLADPFSSILL